MTILSVAEFREHVTTGLGDDAVERLLDAAEAEIVRYAGDPGSAVELLAGGSQFLVLSRPASSITTITEQARWSSVVTTLATDDYLLHPDGYRLERISGGTHSRWTWHDRVSVTYTPEDDAAIRIGVQLDLVNLALNFNPGTVSERIGDWAETFQSAIESNAQQRDEILGRLDIGPSLVVVGGSRSGWPWG